MSKMISVRPGNADQFYRYKMPSLESKIEGKGNGIKTVVVNLKDISEALSRKPDIVLKHFGFALGAQTSVEINDRHIINGSHDSKKLQESLYDFITNFVLCSKCQNPETVYRLTPADQLKMDCKACGETTSIPARLKLEAFIVKSCKGSKGMSNKKAERRALKAAKANGTAPPVGEPSSPDAESGANDGTGGRSGFSVPANVEVVFNAESFAAIADAESAPPAEPEEDLIDDDDDEEENEFCAWVSNQDEDIGDIKNAVLGAKLKELHMYGRTTGCTALGNTIFNKYLVDDCKLTSGFKSEIDTRAPLLKSAFKAKSTEAKKIERCEKAFLTGFEESLARLCTSPYTGLSKVFEKLYDEDVVSEEAFLKWSKKHDAAIPKEVAKSIRDSARPFIEWLKNAEEEE